MIEIDNNWCENAMRDIAIGRKNYPSLRSGSAERLSMGDAAIAAEQWMHLGSQECGPKVAAIMTVITIAQRADHNVRRYLTAVLEKLADPAFKITQIQTRLPGNWKDPMLKDD